MTFTTDFAFVLVALVACSSPQQAVSSPPTRPRVVAHRGASHDHPENTLAAFRAAWALGVEAVELDVRITKDGVAVVIHVATTERVAGVDRAVADQTLAELRALDVGAGERIPLLVEALATIPAGRTMFVEIKTPRETARVIADVIGARTDIALQSFDAEALAALQQLTGRPAYWTVSPQRIADVPQPYPLVLIEGAKLRGFTGLALSHGSVTPEFVAAARAAGLQLDVWTVNDAAQLADWLAQDVRWVETDRPTLTPNLTR
jgi:glycerophosphoryl diester phosphodiesterase